MQLKPLIEYCNLSKRRSGIVNQDRLYLAAELLIVNFERGLQNTIGNRNFLRFLLVIVIRMLYHKRKIEHTGDAVCQFHIKNYGSY